MRGAGNRVVAGSVPRDSNQVRAASAMTRHSFAPGRGYWEHDQPPILHNQGAPVAQRCDPPAGTPDGTKHTLRFGSVDLVFTWVASERAWHRHGGLRLAFTADYLTREGWEYIGRTR